MKLTLSAIFCLMSLGLILPVAQAGPQGTILVRELDTVTIDGDISDWPIENFEAILELPPTPEALEAETVDVQGDHLVYNIDQVGFFNGTEAAHLSDGGEGDFGASTYFAHDAEFLYILHVVTDEAVRGDRDMSEEGNQGFLNDGFEFFIDAAGDSDDCVAMGATFEDEDPNRDDMQITVALNDTFLPEGADADQLGVRQGLERGGNPLLVNEDGGTKNGPGGLYRDALDALDNPNTAARKTDDGYVIELRIPFGFIPEFVSDHGMKYTQFWNDFDTDDGPGGANKSWVTWGQQSTVTCEADEDPPAALFHAGTWAAMEFVTDNPLNNKPGPNISLRTKVNFGQLDIPPTEQELTIPVRNTGITNPLAIADVTVGGTNGDRFTVVSFPNSLDAKAGGDIVLNFDSQGITGPYEAVLEVTNDDAEPEDQTRQVAITLTVVDPAGPFAHLKLDELDGTTLADSSGNGRDGTLEAGGGSATLNQDPLASGKAIDVSGGGSVRLEGKPFGLLDSFSVSLWFQVADAAGQGTIVSRGGGGAPIFAVLQSGANASFFVNDGAIFETTGELIQADTAHHLVATYDNTEGARRAAIFIDGVEAGSLDDPTVLDDFEEDPFWLGSFAQALGFSGQIDDFHYYNRILTAEEVQTLKDNPGEPIRGVTPGPGPAKTELDLLVLGADDTGETGADANVLAFLGEQFTSVRYMNSGATDGSETADVIVMSSTFGSGSVRGKFHNSAAPVINWEEAVMDSGDGEFGQSLVAMTKSTDTTQMALGDHPIAGSLAGTTIEYLTEAGGETLGSGELSAGTVSVGAGVGGAIDGLAMLFVTDTGGAVGVSSGVVDGVSPARRVAFPMTDATFDSLTDTGKELFVNSILWAAGIIDPPALPDIPGVIGYWPLDGSAADASGQGADGNVINPDGVWVDDGGRSAYQSGNGSFIELGTLPVIGSETDFTWSFWVNANASGVNDIVFGNRYNPDGVDFAPREFIKFTPTKFEWHFDGGGQNTTDAPFVEGEWAHNLVVKSGATLTYYRNGSEVASGEVTAGPVNPQPLYLGGQAVDGAAVENFNGLFDEVAIFDRALSIDEVTDVYNRGLNGQALTRPVVVDGPLPGLTNVGIQASGAFGITVPDGATADIEYSIDLIDWEVIATGVTGAVEETDADRLAAPAGYYRAKQ